MGDPTGQDEPRQWSNTRAEFDSTASPHGLTCRACGALVPAGYADTHTEWHRKTK